MSNPTAADQLKHLGTEELLLPVLVQLAVIIAVARVFGILARKVGQPSAVGEIVAGLLLGPSFFAKFFPEMAGLVFAPTLHGLTPELSHAFLPKVFTVLSQLGLIFLLFLIGLEFEFGHLRELGRSALIISLAGMAVPFGLGYGLAYLMHLHLGDQAPPFFGFAMFLGVAMSITALPILGRMMMEWNVTRTRLGTLTISAAAADDAIGWILLTAVAAAVKAEFQWLATLKMMGLTLAFGLFMVYVARPVLKRWVRWSLAQNNGELSLNALAVLLVLLMLSALATNLIGIFAIFGAFLLGAILANEVEFVEAVGRRLRDLVTAFFLPIFFTYTGLRTDIGSLGGSAGWVMAGAVLLAAVVGKFGGCGLAAWLCGFRPREAAIIGVMMNTRALMELIVINIGRDLGVIPDSVFCMLVLMALITTLMTSPILMRLMPGTELESYIQQSDFRKRSRPGSKA